MIGTVRLEGLKFYGYHGYYVEENKLGNHYHVNVAVDTEMEATKDDLAGTIDYESLYKITAEVMAKPLKLLESLAYKIGRTVLLQFDSAVSVTIEIKKINPPIGALCDASSVELKLKKQDIIK